MDGQLGHGKFLEVEFSASIVNVDVEEVAFHFCHVERSASAVETSALCAMLIVPAVTEVAPLRIFFCNQAKLLISSPALNLLLSRDC